MQSADDDVVDVAEAAVSTYWGYDLPRWSILPAVMSRRPDGTERLAELRQWLAGCRRSILVLAIGRHRARGRGAYAINRLTNSLYLELAQ